MNFLSHLNWLGYHVKDKVTGYEGVVESICFDLYGCIQATVKPCGQDKDGKPHQAHWFDISRLTTIETAPVMNPPNFEIGPVAEGKQGAAEKPTRG